MTDRQRLARDVMLALTADALRRADAAGARRMVEEVLSGRADLGARYDRLHPGWRPGALDRFARDCARLARE